MPNWKPTTMAKRIAEGEGKQAVRYATLAAAPRAIAGDACEVLAVRQARAAWRAAIHYYELIEREKTDPCWKRHG